MKKKNLKSLSLNKKAISNFGKQSQIKGGGESIMLDCGTIFDSCQVCPSVTCETAVCPSWWGGQLCDPKE